MRIWHKELINVLPKQQLVTRWKPVKGYEGIYLISNEGEVYSYYTNKKLKPLLNTNGYLLVCLYKKGVAKKFLIHRLVAEAFIPKQTGKEYVNHKDENKKNNNVQNLEWCTMEYNTNYGTRNERSSKKIISIDLISGIIREYESVVSTKQYGLDPSTVIKVIKNKRKFHKNKRFIYGE